MPYHALAGRVGHRAARRRAHDGGRPPARAAARQRQRRGRHAGRAASAARSARLRRADEPPRARARAARTRTTPTPIGLDALGNYSSAEDLVKLTLILRRNAFFRAVTNLPRATLRTGVAPADDRQPQPARARGARGQRRQDRPHVDRRLHPRRLGHAATASRSSRSSSTSPARPRATRTRSRSPLRAEPLPPRHAGAQGRGVRHASSSPTATSTRSSSRRARVVRTARRGERLPVRVLDVPGELDGPLPAGIAGRDDRGPLARAHDRERAARHAHGDRRRPPLLQRGDDLLGRTLVVVILCALALASLQLVLLRRRARPAPAAPGAVQRDRMIITVTLNAAIDKSLSVPNFRLGRRHRTVEQTTMPGGKGVNVARTLKSLGQPVIATGFAGGADRHADRRAAHRGVDPQRLRAHPRGVAHQHRRPRPDQRRDDRDQRARPRGERQGDRALPRQAALPRARRRRRRLRGLAAARRRVRRLRAARSRSCASPACRPWSTPTAIRCAWPSAPSPTSSRPT